MKLFGGNLVICLCLDGDVFFFGRITECEDSKVSCHNLGFLTFKAKSDLVDRHQQKDANKDT